MERSIRPGALCLALLLIFQLAPPRALAAPPDSEPSLPAAAADSLSGAGTPGDGLSDPPADEGGREPVFVVWQEVSTWTELTYYANTSSHLRLTTDLTVEGDVDLDFFPLYVKEGGSQVLDMGSRSITVTEGCTLSFAGNYLCDFTILGDGGTDGLFRVEPGGLLSLGNMDLSGVGGCVASQAEGAWLSVNRLNCRPEQLQFARRPVIRNERFSGTLSSVFARGITPEELDEALPAFPMSVNYQGEEYQYWDDTDPIVLDSVGWNTEEHTEEIAAGIRTTLSARVTAPLKDDPEQGVSYPQDLLPILLEPVQREVAFLVDGAAITDIQRRRHNSYCFYQLCFQYPETVVPEGTDRLCLLTGITPEVSLDGGFTWHGIPLKEKLFLDGDLLFYFTGDRLSADDYTGGHTFHVRIRMDYADGEETLQYRLYTDTLFFSPSQAAAAPDIGGSRGGCIVLDVTSPPPLPQPDDAQDEGGSSGPGLLPDTLPQPGPAVSQAPAGPADDTSAPQSNIQPEVSPLDRLSGQGEASAGEPPAAFQVHPPAAPSSARASVVSGGAAEEPPSAAPSSGADQPQPTTPAERTERPAVSEPQSEESASPPDRPGNASLPPVPLQLALGAGVTAAILAAAVLARPKALLNWLRRLFHRK